MITLIVARDKNGAIGKNNTIPWEAPEDLKFFQRETSGAAIIMGRNTWDSLPFKPLKNRLNIVVTSQEVSAEHNASSVKDAIDMAHAAGHRRVYGIGGAGIYREMLAHADRLLITEVDTEVTDPDTYFPEVSADDWRLIGTTLLRTETPRCAVRELLRRG